MALQHRDVRVVPDARGPAGLIRPSGSTAVASVKTSPAPPTAHGRGAPGASRWRSRRGRSTGTSATRRRGCAGSRHGGTTGRRAATRGRTPREGDGERSGRNRRYQVRTAPAWRGRAGPAAAGCKESGAAPFSAQRTTPMLHPPRFWTLITADPRHGQILTLAGLLTYGLGWLGFDIGLPQVAVTLASALAVQRLGDCLDRRAVARRARKSALISALSLCLLLRTDALWIAALGLGHRRRIEVRDPRPRQARLQPDQRRAGGAAARPPTWPGCRPGQWGTAAAFAFTMACAGHAGRQPRRAQRRDAGVHRAPGRRCWSAARCRSASR